jgi:hypothetical protein
LSTGSTSSCDGCAVAPWSSTPSSTTRSDLVTEPSARNGATKTLACGSLPVYQGSASHSITSVASAQRYTLHENSTSCFSGSAAIAVNPRVAVRNTDPPLSGRMSRAGRWLIGST